MSASVKALGNKLGRFKAWPFLFHLPQPYTSPATILLDELDVIVKSARVHKPRA
jgi:hypothetical protein